MCFEYKYHNLYYSHRQEPENSYRELSRPIFGMLCLVRGEAELTVGNKLYLVYPGDLVVIPPKQVRYIRCTQGAELYETWFTEYLIPRDILSTVGRQDGVYHAADTPIPGLFRRFDEHVGNIGHDDTTLKMLFRCVLTEILVYLHHMGPRPSLGVDLLKDGIDALLEYIDRNIEQPLRLDDICGEFHYSKSYVCREFTAAMGVPIMRYIRAKKILYADALLKTGMPPAYAARQCGFANYSTFFRLYKRQFGRTPTSREES